MIFARDFPSFRRSAAALTTIVREEVARLRSAQVPSLIALPPITQRQVKREGRSYTVAVWHDVLPSGAHRVVAQVTQPRLFGVFSRVASDGIAVSSEGGLRNLDWLELADFS